jgi:cob(I)alamin adenosyltransferase
MKLYTRQGDAGATVLFGGQGVDKDAARVEAYGSVDELNSMLGLAAAACEFDELRRLLAQLQSRLFDLGADLATPSEGVDDHHISRIEQADVERMERMIDEACEPLPQLTSFILPGGTELAARLHAARTVARRAERRIVTLCRVEKCNDAVIPFINRIGDLLFALARRANQLAGHPDTPWQPDTNPPA